MPRSMSDPTADPDDTRPLGPAPSEGSMGLESRLQMAELARKMALADDQSDDDPIRIGRFFVVERVGAGGMGTVFRAYDPDLDRSVALKVLRREVTDGTEQATERMAQEARALARLNHPNVVAVHEVGMANGQRFVAMEMVEGRDLRAWTADAPAAIAERIRLALPLLVQAGRGLAAANAAGIIHRDFKPANVLIGSDDRVRVADFGLARQDGTASGLTDSDSALSVTNPGLRSGISETPKLTRAGTLLGTPAYMAPEQRNGQPLDARADQFSFCLSAWEVLFGQRPRAAIEGPPPTPSGLGAQGRWLARVLRRGMAESPEQRHPDMDALLLQLSHDPARARRRWLTAGAGVLAVGGVLGGLAFEREARCDDVGDPVASVWNDGRREQMAEAFASTQTSMAADSWQRLDASVTAYAHSWAQTATEQCRAAKIEGTLAAADYDAQASCLDARLARVDAMLEVFEHPDKDLVISAPMAGSNLAPAQACLDPRVAARHDPAHAGSTQALARGRGLVDAGYYAQAAPDLAAVIDQAVVDQTPSIEALARVTLGLAQDRQHDNERAEQSYRAAYWLALEHGDDRIAAEAARKLLSLLTSSGRIDDAKALLPYAQVLNRRGDSGPDERSALAQSMAFMALEQGDREAAERHGREAVALAAEAWGLDHLRAVTAQQNFALILRHAGKLEESLELTQAAHTLRRDALGPHHPDTARSAENVAATLGYMGRHDEALALFREALEIYESAHGRQHPSVGLMLSSIGVSLDQVGDDPAALAHHTEASQILRQTLPPGDVRLATAQMNLAMAQANIGHCDTAAPLLVDTLGDLMKVSPGNPRVAIVRSVLGACLIAEGRWVEAEIELAIAAALLQHSPPGHASALGWWAKARLAGNNPGGALALAEQAQSRLEGIPNMDGLQSELASVQARASLALGQPQQADSHSERALKAARIANGDRPGLLEHLADRAELLLEMNRPQDALAPAREGVDLIEDKGWKATLSPPLGGRVHLALARALASTLPQDARQHATVARAWFEQTDTSFDPQRNQIALLLGEAAGSN